MSIQAPDLISVRVAVVTKPQAQKLLVNVLRFQPCCMPRSIAVCEPVPANSRRGNMRDKIWKPTCAPQGAHLS